MKKEIVLLALLLLFPLFSEAKELIVKCVKKPPLNSKNSLYVTNRAPLAPSAFIKLPIGAVKPQGWLLKQLQLEADGMTGHLPELSNWCKFKGSSWASASGKGHDPWEELPYWLKGFGDLGYVLNNERIIKESRKWIEAILSSQDETGWFGPRSNKTRAHGTPDVWPNMLILNVLQSYYEFSGDKRVLPFMSKYFKWELTVPDKDFLNPFWQKIRAGDNLESIYWLYNRTGEKFLLDVAEKVYRRTANWTQGIASWHGVNICQSFRQPAVYFLQAKDKKFIGDAERNYKTVMDLYGQVPGGMFGADENCRQGYSGPRQAAETCSMVEYMHSFEMLTKITGNPKWSDRCEEVAFNSFPASQTPDLKGLHYLTAPNMISLDRQNKSPGLQNGGCMLAYNPWSYRCCQHNVSHGWPYFSEELWLATADNGLCASIYSPSTVTAKAGDGTGVTITEKTDYPFSENIELNISAGKKVNFPLYLRIPGWCDSAVIKINGKIVPCELKPISYAVIDRTWADGDKVLLTLPARISITTWKKNKDAVSINLGPLTYSLKIGEKWKRYGGTDKWPAYEVFPTTPWNYGLAAESLNSIEITKKGGPIADQPFTPEAAPIELHVKARKIPEWKKDRFGLVGKLQESPVKTSEPIETVTLIPMGCARLRISVFPIAGSGSQANLWKAPPEAPAASYCHPGDTTLALNDGLVPKKSNDNSIPRCTWWPHKGTTEWVAYKFKKPKEISYCEVYWFDDSGFGGCRLPESWKILFKDGGKWKPVSNPSNYSTEKDKFNRVTFDAVKTSGIKLEIKLKPDFSGGILEWRTGFKE